MNGSVLALVDGFHELLKRQVRRSPSQSLARALVHQVGNRVERIPIVRAQVRSLGHKLAQQAIGVLAATALPRAVWIAEVHPRACGQGQLAVARHLPALILGKREAHRLGNEVELRREGRQRALGRRIWHLVQSTRRVLRSSSTPTADRSPAP